MNNNKYSLSETELGLLENIDKNPNLTQRDLSTALNVSLGMVNIFLKKLASKSLIKIKKLNKRNLQYLITLEGFKERAKYNLYHLENNLSHYIKVKRKIMSLLEKIKNDGNNRVLIYATGEWQDIFYLGVKSFKFEIVGFVADTSGHFYEYPIYNFSEVEKLSKDRFDCVLALSKDEEYLNSIVNGKRLYTF